jgi:hypothetical protein
MEEDSTKTPTLEERKELHLPKPKNASDSESSSSEHEDVAHLSSSSSSDDDIKVIVKSEPQKYNQSKEENLSILDHSPKPDFGKRVIEGEERIHVEVSSIVLEQPSTEESPLISSLPKLSSLEEKMSKRSFAVDFFRGLMIIFAIFGVNQGNRAIKLLIQFRKRPAFTFRK